jgi:hypothetical protein
MARKRSVKTRLLVSSTAQGAMDRGAGLRKILAGAGVLPAGIDGRSFPPVDRPSLFLWRWPEIKQGRMGSLDGDSAP